MKKFISILLIAVLMLFSVTACSNQDIQNQAEENIPQQSQEESTSTPSQVEEAVEETVVEEVVLSQKNAAMMPEDVTNPGADWFYTMNNEIQAKYQDILALAEEKGVASSGAFLGANAYFSTYAEALNEAIDEAASSESTPEDTKTVVYFLLEMWNELEDFKNNFDGYLGIIQALAKGDDYFSMVDDSVQLPIENGWPQELFFSDYVPQCFDADYGYYCDEYLQGYGMENPVICSISKAETTIEEAIATCDELSSSGMYCMISEYEDNEESCSATWSGSYLDEEDNFVYVQFFSKPKLDDEYIKFELPGMNIPGRAVMFVSNFNLFFVEFAALYAS